MEWTTLCMSWRYYTPADCQEVQVKETFTERFFTRLLLHCNWIYFNFTYTDLLFFTGHSVEHRNLQNKHTMTNINYGLFLSFRNISDKNREEYDLKKHQGQNIWKGNRYRLIVGENKPRILTFSRRRQNRLNGVLGETRTARTRVWASCAHASLCKFTSGSRRSLSRPRILRSLIVRNDNQI